MPIEPFSEKDDNAPRPRGSFSVALGVGVLSGGAIGAEIALSRTLAVAQSHHFAFLIISIALLGYGAAGTVLSFTPAATTHRLVHRSAWGALGFATSLLMAMQVLQRLPFDPYRLAWDSLQWVVVLCYYLVLAVPFSFAGFTIGSAFQTYAEEAPRLYALDLTGAALGALAATLALQGRPVAMVLGGAAALGALASLVFCIFIPGKLRWIGLGTSAVLVLLAARAGTGVFGLPMSPYKPLQVALRNPGADLLETRWSSSARVDRFRGPTTRYAPGLSLAYRAPLPAQEGLTLDGDRQSSITLAGPEEEGAAFLEALSSSLVFSLTMPKRVLVLGSGGGNEVLAAWRAGAEQVEASVADEAVAEILRRARGSGEAFRRTLFVVGNDRLAFEGQSARFDVIQLALTEQPGPGSTGLYHLTEAYLYTVESFQAMLDSLSANGMITVTRYILPPPRTELRLASVAYEALKGQGVADSWRHVAAIRGLNTFTLLISKDALRGEQLSALREFSSRWGFDLVYYPGMDESEANRIHRYPEPIYHRLTRQLLSAEGRHELIKSYPFDLSASTDDSPFFFHTFRVWRLPTLYRAVGRKWTALIEGGYLLPLILLQSVLASLALVALAGQGVRKFVHIRGERRLSVIMYFSALGLGFMGVEIASLEQAILLLGQPVFAMATVVASLLFFAGIGSWIAGKLRPNLKIVCFGVACLAFAGALLFAPSLMKAASWTMLRRVCWTVGLVAPLGLAMGMPFPLGISRLEGRKELVPLAWCANGALSVIGSVGALNLALGVGFSGAWAAAGASYLVAAVTSAGLPKRDP